MWVDVGTGHDGCLASKQGVKGHEQPGISRFQGSAKEQTLQEI